MSKRSGILGLHWKALYGWQPLISPAMHSSLWRYVCWSFCSFGCVVDPDQCWKQVASVSFIPETLQSHPIASLCRTSPVPAPSPGLIIHVELSPGLKLKTALCTHHHPDSHSGLPAADMGYDASSGTDPVPAKDCDSGNHSVMAVSDPNPGHTGQYDLRQRCRESHLVDRAVDGQTISILTDLILISVMVCYVKYVTENAMQYQFQCSPAFQCFWMRCFSIVYPAWMLLVSPLYRFAYKIWLRIISNNCTRSFSM